MNAQHTPDTTRSCSRRNQVLDAATDCFCRHGFHGASMAEISKSAGMSVGHIYHYFENKEAIIAAIVERDLLEMLEAMERFRSEQDVLQAMLVGVDEGLDAKLDRKQSALKIEVLAEAARNEKVAQMIHAADARARASLLEVMLAARRDAPALASSEMDGRLEILAALFEGLMIRALRNPQLEREALLPVLRGVVQALITG